VISLLLSLFGPLPVLARPAQLGVTGFEMVLHVCFIGAHCVPADEAGEQAQALPDDALRLRTGADAEAPTDVRKRPLHTKSSTPTQATSVSQGALALVD
jgi:hypothetical protein